MYDKFDKSKHVVYLPLGIDVALKVKDMWVGGSIDEQSGGFLSRIIIIKDRHPQTLEPLVVSRFEPLDYE